MKKTIIPAGYRLTVVSWENDADNYNTEVIEGLSNERVTYLVSLCKIMGSKNAHKGGFGNIYEPNEKERKGLYKVLEKIIHDNIELFKDDPDFEDGCGDWALEDFGDWAMEDLYDLGLSKGEFFTRVCKSWKVEHVPEAIAMIDVTSNFK